MIRDARGRRRTRSRFRRRVLHGRIDILRAERARACASRSATELEAQLADVVAPDLEGTGDVPADAELTPLPDLAEMTMRRSGPPSAALEQEEDDISLNRRVMHGQIDIIRAERAKRARGGGQHVDAGDLGSILGGGQSSHVYCPECGFQNPEASNYCSRCGALLAARPDRRRR